MFDVTMVRMDRVKNIMIKDNNRMIERSVKIDSMNRSKIMMVTDGHSGSNSISTSKKIITTIKW